MKGLQQPAGLRLLPSKTQFTRSKNRDISALLFTSSQLRVTGNEKFSKLSFYCEKQTSFTEENPQVSAGFWSENSPSMPLYCHTIPSQHALVFYWFCLHFSPNKRTSSLRKQEVICCCFIQDSDWLALPLVMLPPIGLACSWHLLTAYLCRFRWTFLKTYVWTWPEGGAGEHSQSLVCFSL